ncbi:MAG: sulfatase [Myxococcales bacterium]|nr:sulfatase [Myxococcales bacterium]MCB9583252.1 sulfatase [Polyangiaceae bacterium]
MRKILALALLGFVALGCSKAEPSASAAAKSAAPSPKVAPSASAVEPKKPEPQRPYNVLFIMVDSLRADMPWTGYPRQIAPWLTEFGKRSTFYPRSYSLSSYTAKSVVPTLVGKYPSEMRRDGYFFTRWFDDNLFISERAQKAGLRTLAGHGHGYFLPNMGTNQGFDDYRLLPGTFLDTTGVHDITSDRLNKLAKEMLSDPKNVDQTGKKRFFAYFHFLDPHFTYIKHEEDPDYGDKRRDLYDNEVHFTDRWVGDLVDWVDKQPFGKNTVVIITADHGEGFGERGQYRHAYQLWESLIRVPLFIRVPGAEPRRIEVSRSAIDLAPTMADLMGLPNDPPFRGKSLVPEVYGAKAEPRPVISDLPRCDLMDRRRALIDGDYALIAFGDDNNFMLFDVVKDFKEENDLAAKEPEKLKEMKALYEKLSADIPKEPVVGGVPLMGVSPSQRY